MTAYRRVAQLKTADDFRAHLAALGIDMPFDEELFHGPDAPLAQPCCRGRMRRSAIASPFCRWRAGTARATAGPAT